MNLIQVVNLVSPYGLYSHVDIYTLLVNHAKFCLTMHDKSAVQIYLSSYKTIFGLLIFEFISLLF